MAVFVTEVDGTKQLFDREKVVRTCLRMGANRKIAEKIEMNIYDSIETKKVSAR